MDGLTMILTNPNAPRIMKKWKDRERERKRRELDGGRKNGEE